MDNQKEFTRIARESAPHVERLEEHLAEVRRLTDLLWPAVCRGFELKLGSDVDESAMPIGALRPVLIELKKFQTFHVAHHARRAATFRFRPVGDAYRNGKVPA